MKIYKNGMTLMKDTGSLVNALIENTTAELKVNDTFAELMWSDRVLYVISEVKDNKHFKAKRVETYMKNYEDGTEYPIINDDGSYKTKNFVHEFVFKRKNWYSDGKKIHLAFGETTGYRDPSF